MWNMIFLFAGFLLITLLLIVFMTKKKIFFVENRIFFFLALANFIGYISEILLQFTVRSPLNDHSFLPLLLAKIYIIYILVWIGIFSIYTFLVTRKVTPDELTDQGIPQDKMPKYKKMRKYHIIFMIIVAIIIFILPIKIFHEEDSMYSFGPAVEFLRYILIGFVGVWIIRLASNYKMMREKKVIPIFAIIILLLINVIIQSINPSILIATFTMTFTCYTLFFIIENPDLKIIAQLNRANQKAKSNIKIKDEFLIQMGHETNTTMNLLETSINSIKEIAETTKNNELLEWAEYADSSANSLVDMIKNSLASARFKSGDDIKLNNKPYKTMELIKAIQVLPNRFKINKEHIDIKFNFSLLPLILIGDSAAIREIIYNLLSNAYKYTEKGSIGVSLKHKNIDNICRIKIIVKDTGIGIKKGDLKDLFQEFKRIDFEHNQSDKRGLGLGLKNTKDIAELMNGTVTAESEFGKGSTFIVEIDQEIMELNKK